MTGRAWIISLRIALPTLGMAFLLSGCETTDFEKPLPPPPAAELGPAFEVAHADRYASAIAGVMDDAGRVHLVIASPMKNQADAYEVRHLVIGPQGVESSEQVAGALPLKPLERREHDADPPLHVDLAFDRAGRLHVLAGNSHYLLKDGTWTGNQPTPWELARFTPVLAGFVQNVPGLTWYAVVNNIDLGLPDDAKNSTYRKLVVTPEELHPGNWYALAMEDQGYTRMMGLIADDRGTIHFYYQPEREDAEDRLRYAAFRVDEPCTPAPKTVWFATQHIQPMMDNGTPACPVLGASVAFEQPLIATPQAPGSRPIIGEKKFAFLQNEDVDVALAMDPASGAILVTGGNLYSVLAGSHAPRSVLARVPAKYAALLPAPAGNNRFHALMAGMQPSTLYYLAYMNGAWSAPVAVGSYSVPDAEATSPVHMLDGNFRIIADERGHALLVWPEDDTLRARWVSLK